DQEQADKILTEDDLETCKEEIQSLTKKYETKVNETADKKSAEILEV
ncbi:MAG: ribosome-recycling factor, partial [Planctomycetaceae bacterium]|nr:ribosome-recycling factor [Planctomycetaceae bacterium]